MMFEILLHKFTIRFYYYIFDIIMYLMLLVHIYYQTKNKYGVFDMLNFLKH